MESELSEDSPKTKLRLFMAYSPANLENMSLSLRSCLSPWYSIWTPVDSTLLPSQPSLLISSITGVESMWTFTTLKSHQHGVDSTGFHGICH